MNTLLNRRGVMIQKELTDCGYDAHGLIFWLDGIDKGGSEGYWTDLVGGIKFPINSANVTQYGLTFTGNSIDGDGDVATTAQTIIVVYSQTSSVTGSNRITVFNSSLVQWDERYGYLYHRMIKQAVSKFAKSSLTWQRKTFAITSGKKAYINGVATGSFSSGSASLSLTDHFIIGGTNYKGELCSIRLYNRALSDAELVREQAVDMERFLIQ